VQIKRVNGLYGGVDLAVSKDVFKGIDKDWNKKVEELAW
jgi:hypothetical protein